MQITIDHLSVANSLFLETRRCC